MPAFHSQLLIVAAMLFAASAMRRTNVEHNISQLAVQNGACSDTDLAAVWEAGSGNGDKSFSKKCADCGSNSWSLWGGFNTGKFVTCLQKSVQVSTPCGHCFAESGKYGFDNCKFQCMGSWCSQSCLDCVHKQKSALLSCTGASELPEAPCCGGDCRATTTKPTATSAEPSTTTTMTTTSDVSSTIAEADVSVTTSYSTRRLEATEHKSDGEQKSLASTSTITSTTTSTITSTATSTVTSTTTSTTSASEGLRMAYAVMLLIAFTMYA